MESWRDELYHHGILGQRWGVRRYQNPDGTLTEEGRKRLGRKITKLQKQYRASIGGDWKKSSNDHQKQINLLKKTKEMQTVLDPVEKNEYKSLRDWVNLKYGKAIDEASLYYAKQHPDTAREDDRSGVMQTWAEDNVDKFLAKVPSYNTELSRLDELSEKMSERGKSFVKQCLKDSNNSNDFDESDVWRLTYFATH